MQHARSIQTIILFRSPHFAYGNFSPVSHLGKLVVLMLRRCRARTQLKYFDSVPVMIRLCHELPPPPPKKRIREVNCEVCRESFKDSKHSAPFPLLSPPAYNFPAP